MTKIKFVIVALILFNSSLLTVTGFSQWEPDKRLTFHPDTSRKCYNMSWGVASEGSFVHAVWHDTRDGNREIYYKRSTNSGISWGPDIRLTNEPAKSHAPAIAVSGDVVNIVWDDQRDGNSEIYYKRSTDKGITWGSDTRLTNDAGTSYLPSVVINGLFIHVVWTDVRNGKYKIYYIHSTNGGLSWGSEKRLSEGEFLSLNTSVAVSGQDVYVVWTDKRYEDIDEIFLKHSTNNGIDWGDDVQLTNNNPGSTLPCISASGDNVYVVWSDYRNYHYDIYYKFSTDRGLSWDVDMNISTSLGNSLYANICSSDSTLHVVWLKEYLGNSEIYYAYSTDGGINWFDERLTFDPSVSENPSICFSGSILHVLWSDNRDGNYEIYYKRNPTGNPIGIKNINSDIPNDFILYQNYPNPFNPSTVIKFEMPQNGRFVTQLVRLIIYDVTGRIVETLINEYLPAGTYQAEWNGDNFSSGVYFYKLISGNFSDVKRMLFVK